MPGYPTYATAVARLFNILVGEAKWNYGVQLCNLLAGSKYLFDEEGNHIGYELEDGSKLNLTMRETMRRS